MGDDRYGYDCGEKECMRECKDRCYRECYCDDNGNSGFIWIIAIILIFCFCNGGNGGKGGLFGGLF